MSESKLQGYEHVQSKQGAANKIRVNKLFAKHTINNGPMDENLIIKECEVSSQSTKQLNYWKNSLDPHPEYNA